VADYLTSLEKVRELDCKVVYPSHGSPATSPEKTLDLFRKHRLERIAEVEKARSENPGVGVDDLLTIVYGKRLPPRLREAAGASVEVILHHLDSQE